MDLVSIVVPIYNVSRFLEYCLSSISKQSYKELEIILIDDGSTDGSDMICKKYLTDTRFRYFYKSNGGLSDARNYGIDLAKGKYISFVDSDDVISYDYIKILVNDIIESNADISIVSFKYIDEDNKDALKSKRDKFYKKNYNSSQVLKKMYDRKHNIDFVTAWGKLFKASLFDNVRFPFGKRNEDEFTTYKLYLKAQNISYNNRKLYFYRIRMSSIMNSDFSIKNLDILEALEMRKKIFDESKVSNKIKTLNSYMYCLNTINIIVNIKRYDINYDVRILNEKLSNEYHLWKFIRGRIGIYRLIKIIIKKKEIIKSQN